MQTAEKSRNEMTLGDKIREDWGTVRFFCRKNKINYNTFGVVAQGAGVSKPITDLLISYGYINDASELKKKKENKVA